MRMIDVDLLAEIICEKWQSWELTGDECKKLLVWLNIVSAYQEHTKETMPARHGKWTEDDLDRWRCSECNKGNHYAYSWDSTRGNILQDHYCPYCGAKMEGADDD